MNLPVAHPLPPGCQPPGVPVAVELTARPAQPARPQPSPEPLRTAWESAHTLRRLVLLHGIMLAWIAAASWPPAWLVLTLLVPLAGHCAAQDLSQVRCLSTYACACGAMSVAHLALLRRGAPGATAQALCSMIEITMPCCVISAEEEYRKVDEEGRRQLRSGWWPAASLWGC